MKQIKRFVVVIIGMIWMVGFVGHVFAQSYADSPLYCFRIAKEVKHPLLKIVEGPIFVDTDGDSAIGANEKCTIVMKITNNGEGEGFGLVSKIDAEGTIDGIKYSERSLANIPVGDTITIEYPIETDMNTLDGQVKFTVYVEGPYVDANTRKEAIIIHTRKFQEPLVVLTDYEAAKEGGGSLMRGEAFFLTVMIQNVAEEGLAEEVQVELKSLKSGVMISGDYLFTYQKLHAFEKQEMKFKLFINDAYEEAEIPLAVKISEKHGKYARDTTISLRLSQPLANSIIEVKPQIAQPKNTGKATIRSDVDRDIPETSIEYPHRYAIIIGNEDYDSQQSIDRSERNVPYAVVDAEIFKEYCEKMLGIKDERKIQLCKNASKKQMKIAIDGICGLVKNDNNPSEIVFYYAGHGCPGEDSIPYLIPVDADAYNMEEAISLYELFNQLSETGARVTVFLDACFTGVGREGNLLVTRGAIKAPKKDELSGKIVVFSATSAEQQAFPCKEQKHGLFTYFLLKKLRDTKGKCTYSELSKYLKEEVPLQCFNDHKKYQTPEVRTGPWVEDSWGEWRFVDE